MKFKEKRKSTKGFKAVINSHWICTNKKKYERLLLDAAPSFNLEIVTSTGRPIESKTHSTFVYFTTYLLLITLLLMILFSHKYITIKPI